jgi:hypothetical protein
MHQLHRRGLIGGLGIGLIGCSAPAVLRRREARPVTASQTEGPFYPYDDKPTDHDADLVRVTGVDAQAQGQVAHVTGVVSDRYGAPLGGALIEIWQCDQTGRYLHREDPNTDRPRDPGFQGYGKAMTDARGAFRFRTIKPVAYSAMLGGQQIWRAPHIHATVSTGRHPTPDDPALCRGRTPERRGHSAQPDHARSARRPDPPLHDGYRGRARRAGRPLRSGDRRLTAKRPPDHSGGRFNVSIAKPIRRRR